MITLLAKATAKLVDAMRLASNQAEQLAEPSHQFAPHRRLDFQSLEDRRSALGRYTTLASYNLPRRPIEQLHVSRCWYRKKSFVATIRRLTITSGKYTSERTKLKGTFDNGATLGELRALVHAYRVTADERYKTAMLLGFDHVLAAQYSNGGWPQFFPLSERYHRHITFNDGTMIRLLEFLRDATTGDDFDLLDAGRRTAAATAIDRGVGCILKCQVIVDGTPTVWCAQHDAESLAPVQARSYELPSLSGAESAGILMFLMSLKNPRPEVIRAVEAGVLWFESAKIEGFRYSRSKTEPALTKDLTASPLWARFYEIKTTDRCSVIVMV